MTWIKQEFDTNMPEWLKEVLKEKCDCGFPVENWYNKDMECTRRRCSNPSCNNSMAAKAAKMLDILSVQGIREKTALTLIKQYQWKSYFDIIPYVYTDSKCVITLDTLFRFGFIFGIDDFTDIVQDYNTVQEVLDNYYGKYRNSILEVKDELQYGEKLFDIKRSISNEEAFKYPCLLTGDVNIHGAIPGMEDNREAFIPAINACYKGFVRFGYAKSARKTGMFCTISQQRTGASRKLEDAISSGYPIYTHNEFIDVINETIQKAGYVEELKEIFS